MDQAFQKGRRLLISACLLGLDCTYTGGPNSSWERGFKDLLPAALREGIEFFPVCPELFGGLPTPRPPAECFSPADDILAGKGPVRNNRGEDVTAAFVKGATETLRIARTLGLTLAVMKARSPSCGVGQISSGRFDGTLVPGDGVSARLLKNSGIVVFNDETFLRLWREKKDFSFISGGRKSGLFNS